MFELPKAQHIGLMLDYDGTLTPIVENPKDAQIAEDKLNILKQLAQSPKISLAIVSGRSVQQLEGFLGDLTSFSVIFCGLHGGEIVQYSEKRVLKTPLPSIQEKVAHFKSDLESLLAAENILDRIFLEDKGYSLAMHYRLAGEPSKAIAMDCFCTAFKGLNGKMEAFRSQEGKEVLELVPKDFSKGACVEFLMDYWHRESSGIDRYPIYVGDDLTDEAAFISVNRLGGTSVRVGESKENTYARSAIRSINLLYDGLNQLLLRSLQRFSGGSRA